MKSIIHTPRLWVTQTCWFNQRLWSDMFLGYLRCTVKMLPFDAWTRIRFVERGRACVLLLCPVIATESENKLSWNAREACGYFRESKRIWYLTGVQLLSQGMLDTYPLLQTKRREIFSASVSIEYRCTYISYKHVILKTNTKIRQPLYFRCIKPISSNQAINSHTCCLHATGERWRIAEKLSYQRGSPGNLATF